MTLLLMSALRMIFYIPLASFRVAALVLPSVFSLPDETYQKLLALGVIFYGSAHTFFTLSVHSVLAHPEPPVRITSAIFITSFKLRRPSIFI